MDVALKMKMLNMAASARHNARAFTGFHVGAALLTENGEIITGCNVELKSALSSICAERTALVKAVSLGHENFAAIAVVADASTPTPPCAFCRQYLMDFNPQMQVVMGNADLTEVVEKTISELYPMAFTGTGG